MPLTEESDAIVYQDTLSSLSCLGDVIQDLGGKTLVITGAAGFMCSHFVDLVALANKTVLKEPCKVIAVDNFSGTSGNLGHLEDDRDVTVLKHDIRKPLDIGRADFIVHGASIASPAFYRKYPVETMDVNTIGTRNMLELAKSAGSKSFVFISSSETYGNPPENEIPTKENYRGNVSFTGPRACYDESKRFGETICMVFHRQHGIPIKITRPFNVYGPRMSLNDKRVIPDFISNALAGGPVRLFSDGTSTRTFCYVSDAVVAHFRVLLSGKAGEAFNIGNSQSGEISMKDLAGKITQLSGISSGVVFGKSEDPEYLVDNPMRRCPDTTKIETELGWRAGMNLEEGLRRTIEWHRSKRPLG